METRPIGTVTYRRMVEARLNGEEKCMMWVKQKSLTLIKRSMHFRCHRVFCSGFMGFPNSYVFRRFRDHLINRTTVYVANFVLLLQHLDTGMCTPDLRLCLARHV